MRYRFFGRHASHMKSFGHILPSTRNTRQLHCPQKTSQVVTSPYIGRFQKNSLADSVSNLEQNSY